MADNWAGVEFKHLRALRAVATARTFWAAAQALNTSQSSVSDYIAALEALTGQRLIERSRGRRTVELTQAGRLLLGHADSIEARLRAAQADFRSLAAGQSGTLRVGIYQSVANKLLPEVMRRFRESRPHVDIQLAEQMDTEELVAAVERGELDLSFAVKPVPEGPLEIRELMRDPYVLITAAGSPIAKRRPTVADLKDLAMVGYYPGPTEDVPEAFLRGRGITPRFVFRSNDNGTVQGMVGAGIGVALAPLLAVDETDPKIALVELADPIPPRILAMVWHRDRYRPPASETFIEMAAEVAREVERAHNEILAKRPQLPLPVQGRGARE
jgi:DNA-binding transcriptional LysR family regulator